MLRMPDDQDDLPPAQRLVTGTLRRERSVELDPTTGRVRGTTERYRETCPLQLHKIAARYPLDITNRLVAAGMELRDAWDRAGLEPRQVGSYSPLGRGGDGDEDRPIVSSWAIAHALGSIGQPTVRAVVELVVINDVPDSRVGLLKVGLMQLARYYGLEE